MEEKRAKVKFLMLILGKTYWQVSLQKRLQRLKMCLAEDQNNTKYGFRYEEA